ncbi:MAG TPA: hypothetical protein VK465_06920, partial [Fibrobacteria bacterium]|nr:hypothetical protein [Fibrobacteria bacterium]
VVRDTVYLDNPETLAALETAQSTILTLRDEVAALSVCPPRDTVFYFRTDDIDLRVRGGAQ